MPSSARFAVQQALAWQGTVQPEDQRIELRIGINLGDVIIDGNDIYGDGVNIAARMEGLADAGGVRISAPCSIRSAANSISCSTTSEPAR